ncbi:hypothetical protein [Roseomonas sp. CECT 9278]|uniref:hypothetical protein n=1 Tax=Roseomonas sp. CECT 9278 TaxID=2845823 RepID=UPI001E5A557B|nr:hypothetical protein [Roseomonas sp. CECT 9278]
MPPAQAAGRRFFDTVRAAPRGRRHPIKKRDITIPTHHYAARRTPRTAPTTPAPIAGHPEQGGLSAAEIRRIVLDILG